MADKKHLGFCLGNINMTVVDSGSPHLQKSPEMPDVHRKPIILRPSHLVLLLSDLLRGAKNKKKKILFTGWVQNLLLTPTSKNVAKKTSGSRNAPQLLKSSVGHQQYQMNSIRMHPWFFGHSRRTRWWFETFFIFTPTWGNDPI